MTVRLMSVSRDTARSCESDCQLDTLRLWFRIALQYNQAKSKLTGLGMCHVASRGTRTRMKVHGSRYPSRASSRRKNAVIAATTIEERSCAVRRMWKGREG